MKKWVITLYPGTHYRNVEGKEKIRQELVKQGYQVKSEFDQSLTVYENAPLFTKEDLWGLLLCLMAIGYITLLEAILGGLL